MARVAALFLALLPLSTALYDFCGTTGSALLRDVICDRQRGAPSAPAARGARGASPTARAASTAHRTRSLPPRALA